jgi:UDP-sulfoquinovose synthase
MRILILGIDGYLGWTLALWLSRLGCKIAGVDNFARRGWLKDVGSTSVVPIAKMKKRIKSAKKILNADITFKKFDILNHKKLNQFIKNFRPETIVHYGECPSAPYSMIDYEHASNVQKNNVIGTLGILFSLHEWAPQASLIKLGTMGEYGTPLSGRPIFEGFFPDDAVLSWNNCQWTLEGEMTPRDPGSFYHISKVQDTINIFKACKFWNLRSYDVMQGVIYGVHTDEVSADPLLRTRLDIDEYFGTVINRFVSQAIIGFPLTIYGTGQQIRSFIALEDAMQCMTRLIAKPPDIGEYGVVNQMSGYYCMKELAETVARVGKKEFNLDVNIQYLENPRVEAAMHPFDPVSKKLPEKFGFVQTDNLEKEITRMFELLSQPRIKKNIENLKHLILPKTWWSGQKKVVKNISINEN